MAQPTYLNAIAWDDSAEYLLNRGKITQEQYEIALKETQTAKENYVDHALSDIAWDYIDKDIAKTILDYFEIEYNVDDPDLTVF